MIEDYKIDKVCKRCGADMIEIMESDDLVDEGISGIFGSVVWYLNRVYWCETCGTAMRYCAKKSDGVKISEDVSWHHPRVKTPKEYLLEALRG